MTWHIEARAVSGGIAIGRALVLVPHLPDMGRRRIGPQEVEAELARARHARDAAVQELHRLRQGLPPDAPAELDALLDVHLLLLQDETVAHTVSSLIRERRHSAEWALHMQMRSLARQFDAMPDAYLRERKSDLEQLTARVLRHLQGSARDPTLEVGMGAASDAPAILVAHDLSPADMLLLRQQHSRPGRPPCAGLVLGTRGATSHTAIVARSMGIPAVLGAGDAVQRIQPGDPLIVDGGSGLVLVRPPRASLRHYHARARHQAHGRERLERLRFAPACTRDGARVELLANIEQAADSHAAVAAGAVGVGLFRTEFLFLGRRADAFPDEEAQYRIYRQALEGLRGLPLTIRTLDAGGDKALEGGRDSSVLGLRGIRVSLARPALFRTQLRAILRAAAHGPVQILLPMLSHPKEAVQALEQIQCAHRELESRGICPQPVPLGAMIEVPAAALALRSFLPHFDFFSIGTNDLIQYTLAVDRGDEAVSHLYDPLHPAVLRLLADVIQTGARHGKPVCVCGEMAGDPRLTALLLGLGLRSFSMPATRILPVKEQILRADIGVLGAWAQGVLQAGNPAALLDAGP